MRLGKDQHGLSLIEMVIAIAVIGIFAGFSINMMAHVRSANIEKAVQAFSDDMSKAQLRTRTREKFSYIYVTVNDGYFYGYVTDENNYKAVTSSIIAEKGHCYGKGIDIRFFSTNSLKRKDATVILTEGVVAVMQFNRRGDLEGFHCRSGVGKDSSVSGWLPFRITFEGRKKDGEKISAMGKQIKFSYPSGRHFIEPLEIEPDDAEKP